MKIMIVALGMLCCVAPPTLSLAAGSDSCTKDCRNFQQACLKAHSQGACKTDYDICIKHCKEK
jgi:hypothetical protein